MHRYASVPRAGRRQHWVEDDSEIVETKTVDLPTIEVMATLTAAEPTGLLDADGNNIVRLIGGPLGFDLRGVR